MYGCGSSVCMTEFPCTSTPHILSERLPCSIQGGVCGESAMVYQLPPLPAQTFPFREDEKEGKRKTACMYMYTSSGIYAHCVGTTLAISSSIHRQYIINN